MLVEKDGRRRGGGGEEMLEEEVDEGDQHDEGTHVAVDVHTHLHHIEARERDIKGEEKRRERSEEVRGEEASGRTYYLPC